LRDLLDRGDFERIAEMASQKKRLLGTLVSLTFDADPQIACRAVEAMGMAAGCVARDDPRYVRNHLRRLHWLLSEESGGVCWKAPEAMAEVVRCDPRLFADYVPIVMTLLLSMAEEDLDHFRAGILWAMGRLAAVAGDHAHAVLPAINAALDDPNPQVRGMAVWCLGEMGKEKIMAARPDMLPDMLADQGPVDFYENRFLGRTSVCRLVRRAVDREPAGE
jgi:hypothetical protein